MNWATQLSSKAWSILVVCMFAFALGACVPLAPPVQPAQQVLLALPALRDLRDQDRYRILLLKPLNRPKPSRAAHATVMLATSISPNTPNTAMPVPMN